MRGVIQNNTNSYNLFFFVPVVTILFFHPVFSFYANTLSSTEYLTVSGTRTIVSLGDHFELGFFSLAASMQDSDRWYLGIWYKTISERTYVWVANRDNPLSNSTGTLKISGMNLVLLDQSNSLVWSTNLTGGVRIPVVAELLPNGNFVLRESKSNGEQGLLWQSFDYPTDTILPQMKLGFDLRTGHNRFLTSSKNPYDPSSGSFSCKLEIEGLPEFFIRRKVARAFRSGPWDGIGFSGLRDMQTWNNINIVYNLTENKEEVVFTYRVTTSGMYSRLQLTFGGSLQLYRWNPTREEWDMFWMASWKSDCGFYSTCTPNSYCDANTKPVCNCLKGFKARDQMYPPECDRKTQLRCSGDGFHRLMNVKLPDTEEATVDESIGLKECEKRCLRDCTCTAFANTYIRGGTGCVLWNGQLYDTRNLADGGQDLYVRLAAVDLEKTNDNSGRTIGLSVGATILFFLSIITFFFWRKHKRARAFATRTNCNLHLFNTQDEHGRQNLLRTSRRHLSGEITEDLELPLMEYDVISMATNGFSNCNKLGEGGFGTVYKGRLPDGEEIAVKRLSEVSTQGTVEFATEVQLIAKLQHNNLVRLLGCYADMEEKILVYEYMENLSLDYYIFDDKKSSELNWQMRFDIIKGIARGLLYLHQDSRCKVIHRDLKASNILLDKDMIPKISDFGMARIFARDEDEDSTQRVVGTHGYMSPEYMTSGTYSEKSDVFSFGVLLLEIVTGRRNRGFTSWDMDTGLLKFVWRNMEEGKGYAVVDPNITDLPSYRLDEILRCITIGLTCVQIQADDRPTMSWVVLMLGSETEPIRKPGQPFCFAADSHCDTDSSSSSSYGFSLPILSVGK